MNIDLEYDILYTQQQQKKKYNTSNFKARTRRKVAEKNDELLCLSHTKSIGQHDLASFLSDEEKCSELTANEDDDFRFTLVNDVDLSLNENDTMITSDTEQVLNSYGGANSDDNEFSDELSCDNDSDNLFNESSQLLHQFSSISTRSFCIDLLKLLRDADVSKDHSKRFISLIKSVLPIPNTFPSTFENLLSLLDIPDLFIKRSVCLMCKTDLYIDEKQCSRCQITDEKMKADIYDVDIHRVLKSMLKRLSFYIEEYKHKIINNIDEDGTKDIPFGRLYKKLLEKHCSENIISLILHLDGIGLTRSTNLKMWLFSGALVELPPILRYRRHNMILLSIWIGYAEPDPDIWLRSTIIELIHIKAQGMHSVSERNKQRMSL
jgi:hypothetical protein